MDLIAVPAILEVRVLSIVDQAILAELTDLDAEPADSADRAWEAMRQHQVGVSSTTF